MVDDRNFGGRCGQDSQVFASQLIKYNGAGAAEESQIDFEFLQHGLGVRYAQFDCQAVEHLADRPEVYRDAIRASAGNRGQYSLSAVHETRAYGRRRHEVRGAAFCGGRYPIVAGFRKTSVLSGPVICGAAAAFFWTTAGVWRRTVPFGKIGKKLAWGRAL